MKSKLKQLIQNPDIALGFLIGSIFSSIVYVIMREILGWKPLSYP